MSEPAVLPDEPEPRGTVKTYIEGYGWALLFGERRTDEQRADLCGDMFAAYENDADVLSLPGRYGAINVHVHHPPPENGPRPRPKVTTSTDLRDSRKGRP